MLKISTEQTLLAMNPVLSVLKCKKMKRTNEDNDDDNGDDDDDDGGGGDDDDDGGGNNFDDDDDGALMERTPKKPGWFFPPSPLPLLPPLCDQQFSAALARIALNRLLELQVATSTNADVASSGTAVSSPALLTGSLQGHASPQLPQLLAAAHPSNPLLKQSAKLSELPHPALLLTGAIPPAVYRRTLNQILAQSPLDPEGSPKQQRQRREDASSCLPSGLLLPSRKKAEVGKEVDRGQGVGDRMWSERQTWDPEVRGFVRFPTEAEHVAASQPTTSSHSAQSRQATTTSLPHLSTPLSPDESASAAVKVGVDRGSIIFEGSVSPGATGGARKTRSQNRLSQQEPLAVPSAPERSRGNVAAKALETGGKRQGNGTWGPDRSRPPAEESRQPSRPPTSPRLPEDLRRQEGIPSLWQQQQQPQQQPLCWPTGLLFRDFFSPVLPLESTISLERNADLFPRSIPQAIRPRSQKRDAALKEVEAGVKGSADVSSLSLRMSRPARLKFSASSLADMSDSEEEEKISLSPARHGK
ncbi:Paired box protein Pax-3 [Sparganum proliferum]